jgi:hypothetical protein
MKDENQLHGESLISAERKLLRALAEKDTKPALRDAIHAQLKRHKFAEPDHEVIYRALATIKSQSANAQEELIRAVTRLGFPDIDTEAIFLEKIPTDSEIGDLLKQL